MDGCWTSFKCSLGFLLAGYEFYVWFRVFTVYCLCRLHIDCLMLVGVEA